MRTHKSEGETPQPISDREFWRELRRAFLTAAKAIEMRYPSGDGERA